MTGKPLQGAHSGPHGDVAAVNFHDRGALLEFPAPGPLALEAGQEDLGTKWAPRFVRLVEQIPLTGTNKVDKRPLRREAWLTTDPVWWRPFVGRGADDAKSSYRLLTAADVDGLHDEIAAHGRTGLLEF